MIETELRSKLRLYQITVIFSILFALIGFSYNVWRMEVSEQNDTIRTASFELLKELAELEQIIYVAHYDSDPVEGNPRKGWVKVGLISELSPLTSKEVMDTAEALKKEWSEGWSKIDIDRATVDGLVDAINISRSEIRSLLSSLE